MRNSKLSMLPSSAAAVLVGLVVAPVLAGQPMQTTPLVPEFPNHGGVVFSHGFTYTPDGQNIVFAADYAERRRHEIFRVALAPVVPLGADESADPPMYRLNGPLRPEGRVVWDSVRLSPTGDFVVYVADAEEEGRNELYLAKTEHAVRVDRDGLPLDDDGRLAEDYASPPATKLSPAITKGGQVFATGIAISPDGSRVVFRARTGEGSPVRLHSAPRDGGPATVLTPGFEFGSEVASAGLSITPDGSTVVYLANPDRDRTWRLYAAPITGGESRELSHALPDGGTVDPLGITLSPDGSHVIYRAHTDSRDQIGLFASSLTGAPAPRVLHGDISSGTTVLASGLQFAADNQLVFVTQSAGNERAIWSVNPASGAAPVRVATASPGWRLALGQIRVSAADGLVYFAEERAIEDTDQDRPPVFERRVAAAPLSGGEVNVLTHATPHFRGFVPINGTGRVAVLADFAEPELVELFVVNPADRSTTRLNPDLHRHGDVLSVRPHPDGESVIFFAAVEGRDKFELFHAPVDGSAPARRLNDELASRAQIYDARFTPDGSAVVFTGDQRGRGVIEMFRADLAPTAPPAQMVYASE